LCPSPMMLVFHKLHSNWLTNIPLFSFFTLLNVSSYCTLHQFFNFI
jgi:hypothetical protein